MANNLTTTSSGYALDARQGKVIQDQIVTLNTKSVGYNQNAYVTFSSYGDYWWVSSVIPCFNAENLYISLCDNVMNTSANVNSAIAQSLFEIRKYKNHFTLITNNKDIAGYIFKDVHPGMVWEVHYSVTT